MCSWKTSSTGTKEAGLKTTDVFIIKKTVASDGSSSVCLVWGVLGVFLVFFCFLVFVLHEC